MKQLIIGSWNVRILMDTPKADRLERRTALIARELARYHVDIAALSETRRANERQLTEDGSGYCFFWSGRTSEERREAGVGFVIMSHLVSKLASLPRGLNDRLMVMQLQLTNKQKATLISAYAPTMTNPEEVKDQFYEQLDALRAAVPNSEKLIILGDYNARVGTDYHKWSGVIDQQGTGKCNINGLLLLQICTAPELVITNTLFRLPTRSKTPWMHPRSKHWHLIDYVITRKKDASDVIVTKSMCLAECCTDHRLLGSNLRLRIQAQRRPQGKKKLIKRLNVNKLSDKSVSEDLTPELDCKLAELHLGQATIEEYWVVLRDKINDTSVQLLGPTTRKTEDWFDENDEEIKEMLAEKNCLHIIYQLDQSCAAKNTAFTNIHRTVQTRLRKMQDSWLAAKAYEIQKYADTHDSKALL